MIPLDKLLQPLPGENPCGEDPFSDGSLRQLEVLIEPAIDSEEAEIEPDWRKVQEEALKVMERSKDLRVGVILCLALLRREGLTGFQEGLALLHGWSDKFWESIFPLLDAEDPKDPTRVFVFNNLSASLATSTPYRFVKYLRQIPLSQPTRSKPYCLRDVQRAQETKQSEEESSEEAALTPEQISGSFRDTPLEKLQKTNQSLSNLLQTVENLELLVNGKSTGGQEPNFTVLKQTLAVMRDTLAPYLEPAHNAPGGSRPPTGADEVERRPLDHLLVPGGPVRSRAEAETALRAARDYFVRYEPSSPAPLLIDRVLRLSGRSFIESLSELAPGSAEDFKKLFGAEPDKGTEEVSSDAGGKTS